MILPQRLETPRPKNNNNNATTTTIPTNHNTTTTGNSKERINLLDTLAVEQQRGITIKALTATIFTCKCDRTDQNIIIIEYV